MRYQVVLEVRDGNGEVVGNTDDECECDDATQAVETTIAQWKELRPDCTFRELLTVEAATA